MTYRLNFDKLTQKEYDKLFVLDDRRVMLALDIDDIKAQCKEMGINQKDIDFDNVFYQARKNMENTMMDEYWSCLESAIEDSKK